MADPTTLPSEGGERGEPTRDDEGAEPFTDQGIILTYLEIR